MNDPAYDGNGITLETERQDATHWIYLEPEVWRALHEYATTYCKLPTR